MKLLKFVLLFSLLALASGQGFRGFFDALRDPWTSMGEGFRRIFSPLPVAELPPHERLDKNECVCRLSASRRIVGGVVASDIIPWQASLIHPKNNSLFCGATIVNNYYVITTAHCTSKKRADQIWVRVGVMNVTQNDSRKTYQASEIFNGPYKSISVPGDIAIIKLRNPIRFERGLIEPGCLNLIRKSSYRNGLMASGFGTTVQSYRNAFGKYTYGNTSDLLKQAWFHEDFNGCKAYLICINSKDGASACNGDSGGPLHYLDHGITTIEGAASFVRGRGRAYQTIYLCTGFSAYSRFSYYDDWIKSVIGNEYCAK